MTVTILTPKRS